MVPLYRPRISLSSLTACSENSTHSHVLSRLSLARNAVIEAMAAPGGRFFIQDKLAEKAVHHESYKQLWETKWKKPVGCDMLRYSRVYLSSWPTDVTNESAE